MHTETFSYWLDLVTEKERIKEWIDSDAFMEASHKICKAKIKDLLEIDSILATLEDVVLNKV